MISINTIYSDDVQQLSPSTEPAKTDEIKYIVFKSCLLELFMSCVSCHKHCTGKIAYQKGTCIAVRQLCSYCGHKRMWMSQPYIRDIPAGNVLLSAAILFSGATPGKALRLLNHMQVACISDRTFYRHQNRYLEPAILAIWEQKQSRLLEQCKACESPLSIGGDGRADSPGHSAKYGSYGLIDLDTNKVIHIQLVQV